MNVNTNLTPVSDPTVANAAPIKDNKPEQTAQAQPTNTDTVEISKSAKDMAAQAAGKAAKAMTIQTEAQKDQAAMLNGTTAQEEMKESPIVEAKEEQNAGKVTM